LHDPDWKRQRRIELRTGKGRKPNARESVQLFRADAKAIWDQSPWQPLATIWLAPELERRFAHDLVLAGLALADLAPVAVDTLRWVWRRSRLNHDDHEGWQRSLVHARKRQARIGSPPEGYVPQPPGDTGPTDTRIKIVLCQASAYEAARTAPVVDRATKAKLRRRKLSAPSSPSAFDWEAFIDEHWLATFRPLWRSLNITDDPHGATGQLLATAWHEVLNERDNHGHTSMGPAQRRWHALLRQLKDGASVEPSSAYARHNRYLPRVDSRRQRDPDHAEADDATIRELITKIDGHS
jgi:hypothetical protein